MGKFLLLFFCFPLIGFAQRFDFGVQAGMNVSLITGVTNQSLNKLGGYAGLQGGYRISNPLSIRSELMYISKGTARNPNPLVGDFNFFLVHLDYLEMPVLLRWHADPKERFTLDGGLTLGVLLRQYVEDSGGELIGAQTVNPFELGILVGLNYALNERWAVQARFRNSISPILPPVSNGSFIFAPDFGVVNLGPFNTQLSLGISYRFARKSPVKTEAEPMTD